MKKIHENSLPSQQVAGSKGFVDIIDVTTEPITMGIRIVKPNSDVPQRIHKHKDKQIIYLIEGKAQVTNTKELVSLVPGDFVILDSEEEHYVLTGEKEAKLFEVRF
jgi:quercetin dioxygenase-like cupin family protein